MATLTREEIALARKLGVDVNALRAHKGREARAAASPDGKAPPEPAQDGGEDGGDASGSTLKITLHGDLADQIASAAEAAGRSPEELLTEILTEWAKQNGGASAGRARWPRPPAGVKFGAPVPLRSAVKRTIGGAR